MKRLAFAAALSLTAATALAQNAGSGPEDVKLPSDYQSQFIRYAVVDKPDRKIVRFLYANPESFSAARAGSPLPEGTVLIMEDHAARLAPDGAPLTDQQGRFIPNPAVSAIFVQEKEAGWGVNYPETKRNGEWDYARFNPDGTRHTGSMDACFTCHLKTRAQQDFVFNFWDYVQGRT